MIWRALVVLLIGVVGVAHAAWADIRDQRYVALVIGSGAYPGAAALTNAVADSGAIAARLHALGYSVVHLENPTQAEVMRTLGVLRWAAEDAQQVVVYLAGHGVMQAGQAFYVPVDAMNGPQFDQSGQSPSEAQIGALSQTVPLSAIVQALSDKPRNKIIFFDACRSVVSLLGDGPGGSGRGMEAGVVIAFASSPGTVAYDGQNGHSPFAQAFLRHVTQNAPPLGDVLRRMRVDVVRQTQGMQVPWVRSSMLQRAFVQPMPPAPNG
ncbi:caspase family protein [Shimia sp. R9_2]|uniref:caspase family protein n=1 Tax=Shimia sp. R9_2 TaxID=2821112 RepID=UPI001ADB83A8|nr:caspase family protein [Shimia sp. R9_2]